MTRQWVRVDHQRLIEVARIYRTTGYSVRKTADILGCSNANVYHLLRRAAEAGIATSDRASAAADPTTEPIGKPGSDGGVAPFSGADDE